MDSVTELFVGTIEKEGFSTFARKAEGGFGFEEAVLEGTEFED